MDHYVRILTKYKKTERIPTSDTRHIDTYIHRYEASEAGQWIGAEYGPSVTATREPCGFGIVIWPHTRVSLGLLAFATRLLSLEFLTLGVRTKNETGVKK